ncbi:hypothetical protein KXD40_004011 [Peronospora effusa]|uniref:RING-type domain-containing protein n=1 Tax=Peronospora effusa TaxID=542832 RepID=A0A3M6VUM5_9STRA|nr:hypothetical protein DD238_000389 [Peronospora effusa]RQM16624.1 hypothetical protein DD237_001290 [Peronospora effusa]UIZ22910.1 hypothetical protein KXD40_004011 [Peronospora effusa]
MTTVQYEQATSSSAPLLNSADDTRNESTMQDCTSRVEKELARLQDALMCPICEERKKDVVFQCAHDTCEKCGELLSHYPLCRQKIQLRIKRFG